MATKKSGPTLASLNAQIAALQAQADALRKEEVAEVVAKIKDAILRYGLTAADLGLAMVARKNAKAPVAGGGNPASKRSKKTEPKSSAREVKFKDDQGNTWGGMGKRPAWFKAALASGKTREELLAIDSAGRSGNGHPFLGGASHPLVRGPVSGDGLCAGRR